MPDVDADVTTWWGRFAVEAGQAGRWQIGPTTLWLMHLAREWQVVQQTSEDPIAEDSTVALRVTEEELAALRAVVPEEATVQRFSVQATEPDVTLTPTLPDRPVVVRPETSLFVPKGEAVTLYVSTPLWIRIAVGQRPQHLTEVPAFRPSDTWFGPSTREGELCYAVNTVGRLNLDEMPLRPHRALTPVHLRNRAEDAFLVERVQLPVPYLALYQAADGYLWTPPVRLEHERAGGLAALHLTDAPPPEAGETVRLAEPREAARSNVLQRTISTLFHRIREA